MIDCCLVNKGDISEEILEKYAQDGANPVMIDLSRVKRLGIRLFERDFVKMHHNYVRHDPDKLASAILDIYKIH
jgi:hypothetical protein